MSQPSTNQPVDLIMTAGLPYSRRIRVTGATSIWSNLADFEVRSQIRVERSASSTLKANLTPFLSAEIEDDDIVVTLTLSGRDTRVIPSGFYDMIISDVGSEDVRAISVLSGQIKKRVLITAAADE